MAATNRYMNTSGWSFTPGGGSLTAVTGVTSFGYDEGISTKKESADFDGFPTVAVSDFRDPTITLATLDAFALYAVLAGAKGVLTGNVRDAYNGVTAAGGGKSITMTNAAIQARGMTAAHREFASQQLTFGGVSVDGATHPIAIAAL